MVFQRGVWGESIVSAQCDLGAPSNASWSCLQQPADSTEAQWTNLNSAVFQCVIVPFLCPTWKLIKQNCLIWYGAMLSLKESNIFSTIPNKNRHHLTSLNICFGWPCPWRASPQALGTRSAVPRVWRSFLDIAWTKWHAKIKQLTTK